MKFLADENFPGVALRLLRQSGFDVASIAEANPGRPDTDVLAIASAEGRTLLTFDKDFGDLVYRDGHVHAGIVLLRLDDKTTPNTIRVLSALLADYDEQITGHFVVVTENSVRISPGR